MAERKVGQVVYWQSVPPVLSVFRLMPQDGNQFPDYKPGQYIALRREDCLLTKKIGTENGQPVFGPDLDENGHQKIGPVTHSYSISSAPYETVEKKYLEFYIILEKDDQGHPGRLTESIFRIDLERDEKITYVDRITGDFTLDKRAAGFQNVVLVGTGTGLAPFASMIKQVYHEALHGKSDGVTYTLFHTNRTLEELGYHEELIAIEAARKFDFLYIPSISRPTSRDLNDPSIGKGRANNLLRFVFGMPLKEEQELQELAAQGEDVSQTRAALEKTVRPALPRQVSLDELHRRMDPVHTVMLTCGNPFSMADIKYIADSNQIRFEKEDW